MARTSKAVMKERYDDILGLMSQRGGATTLKDIEDMLELPHHVVYVAVSNLRKSGLVVKVPGKTRTQYWGLPDVVETPQDDADTETPEDTQAPETEGNKQLAIDFAQAVTENVAPEPDVTQYLGPPDGVEPEPEPEVVTPPRHDNIPDFTAPTF